MPHQRLPFMSLSVISNICIIITRSYASINDEMFEPNGHQASSVALFSSNLSSYASVPPKPKSTGSDRPEHSPSASHQQNASSSSRARRAKIKRAKCKETLQHKVVEIKPSKKQEISAARLADRLAQTKSTVATPFNVSSIPKNRSGFTASRRKADKAEIIRLRDDVEYFRETVRSLQPVPYRYFASCLHLAGRLNSLLAILSPACVICGITITFASACVLFAITVWTNVSWSNSFSGLTNLSQHVAM